MHYEIDYSKIIDETAKRVKALEDIKNYFGIPMFRKLEKIVKTERDAGRMRRESFIIGLEMFQGIKGYPAEAWADDIFGVEEVVKASPNNLGDVAENACNPPASV